MCKKKWFKCFFGKIFTNKSSLDTCVLFMIPEDKKENIICKSSVKPAAVAIYYILNCNLARILVLVILSD